MIEHLSADLVTVMTAIPTLMVGNLMVFVEGEKALTVIKNNTSTYSSSKAITSEEFCLTGSMSGNILKVHPMTLQVDINVMLLTDGSLILYRNPVTKFKFTLGNRTGKMKLSSLALLVNGIVQRQMFETTKEEKVISTNFEVTDVAKFKIPNNVKELYVITATQTYLNDTLTSGSLVGLLGVKNKGSDGTWKS